MILLFLETINKDMAISLLKIIGVGISVIIILLIILAIVNIIKKIYNKLTE